VTTSIHLTVKQRGQVLLEKELTGRIMIGRSRECSVRLDQPTISSRHVLIDYKGRGPVLRDLGSRNGSYLNGAKLKSDTDYPLADGDQIDVSTFQIAVSIRQDSPPSPLETGSSGTRTIVSTGMVGVHARRAAFDRLAPSLRIGRTTIVLTKMDALVGREAVCDVRIDHPSVSPRHARIRMVDDQSFILVDLRSGGGTNVNGDKISDLQPHPIKLWDTITFGSVTCLFMVKETASQEEAARDSEGLQDQIQASIVGGGARDDEGKLGGLHTGDENPEEIVYPIESGEDNERFARSSYLSALRPGFLQQRSLMLLGAVLVVVLLAAVVIKTLAS